jgi:hypothetical protein
MESPEAVVSLASIIGTEHGFEANVAGEVSPAVIESWEVKEKCL